MYGNSKQGSRPIGRGADAAGVTPPPAAPTNPIERAVQQEIKRRTVEVRIFPNEAALERLVTAVLVEIHEEWATADRRYINWEGQND